MSVKRLGLHLCAAMLLCVALPLASVAQEREKVTVEVYGLTGEVLDNARASLGIARLPPEQARRDARVRRQHRESDGEIRRALEPFGYYRPTIESDLQRTPAGWRAVYTVDPGDPIPLGPVEIELRGPGAQDPTLIAAKEAVALVEGQPLDHRDYETAKQSLSSTATASGYLDARYTEHRVEVDLATYQARVILQLATGHRYRVGSIDFGESRFDEGYLARYLVLQTGDTFTNQSLAEQRTALSRSGHFQEVNIATGAPTGDEGADIPLNIETVPFKPNRFRGRVGWGTDTDFGLQLDWTRRYIGRHGHQFTAGVTAVQDRDSLAGDMSYIIPLQPLQGSAIEIYARHESKDLTFKDVDLDEGGETRIATNLAGGRWHLPVRRVGDFQLESSLGLGLVGEDYDVFEVLFGNLPDSAQDAIIDAIGREAYDTLSPDFEAITLEALLTFGRADDELYIRHGDQFRLELLGANESLGSNISFWQARLSSWTIRPLGENNRLLARTALGYSDADSSEVLGVNFNDMPEYYEFRAGGARSVRGYGFETIFPSDAITGGKHQLVASIEYEHEIIPDWSAAVFVDAGDAFNDFDDFSEKLGMGIGVRWRSPVGVVRVDLGFPLDDADDSFQIYITVGPEF